MKNIVFICLFFFCGVLHTQTDKSFKSGEILKYKISYSGWFKAGKATVSIDEKKINNRFHLIKENVCNESLLLRTRSSSYVFTLTPIIPLTSPVKPIPASLFESFIKLLPFSEI